MLKFAKIAFLLLIFSLPLMKPSIEIGGLAATSSDLLFLIAAGGTAIAIVAGQATLRWHSLFVVLILYFAAMLISGLVAGDLDRAAIKLASQAYLLALPLLAYSLIDTIADLRAVFLTWLAATAVTAGIGCLTVLLFAVGVDRAILDPALHGYGTLPLGPYPRLDSTFYFPAMLCNYLTVSLMILLVLHHLKWIGRTGFFALLAAIGVTAAFTLTPGLGGIALALSVWLFLQWRDEPAMRGIAFAGLTIGGSLAIAFVIVATVTPILHPTAPFLIEVAGIEQPLAPSVRMMTWMAAVASIEQHPLFGAGIGSDAIAVAFVAPSGARHLLTDAHNVFLNVAMQCGLVGLGAMVLLIVRVWQATGPWHLGDGRVIRVGLGLAWLNAFAYQGLTGSYEDARHLWVLLGVLLAAVRLESAAAETSVKISRAG